MNKCAQRGSKQNSSNKNNTKVNSKKTAQTFVWLFAMMMLCFGLILGFTYGALKDSKTATGVLSFSLPPTASATGFNLLLSDGEVYAGNTTSADRITNDTNNSFVIFLKKNANNADANAYFKLTFTFYGSQDITYNGNNTYFKNLNNANDALLSFQSRDTTTLINSAIFTFTTNASLSNYTKLVLDPILAGFSCTSVNCSNVLEINAYIYNDSAMTTQSSSSSTFCKYSSGKTYAIDLISNTDKCTIVSGANTAIERSTYSFSITTRAGYKPTITGLPTNCTTSSFGNLTIFTIAEMSTNLNISISSTPITYTITFNTNGGNSLPSQTYTIETETFTLPTPTKSGYTFTGWTGSNGTTPQTSVSISQGTIGDKSYTANWEEVQRYRITFDDNGTGGLTYLYYAIGTSNPNQDDKSLWTRLTDDTSLTSASVLVPEGMNLYVNSDNYHMGYAFYLNEKYVTGCMNNIGYWVSVATFNNITQNATYVLKANPCREIS